MPSGGPVARVTGAGSGSGAATARDVAGRVLRGGSWNYPAQGARTARRGNADPSFVRGSFGFRLVLAEG